MNYIQSKNFVVSIDILLQERRRLSFMTIWRDKMVKGEGRVLVRILLTYYLEKWFKKIYPLKINGLVFTVYKSLRPAWRMAAGIDAGGYWAPSATGHAPRPRYTQRSETIAKHGVSARPGGNKGDDKVTFSLIKNIEILNDKFIFHGFVSEHFTYCFYIILLMIVLY